MVSFFHFQDALSVPIIVKNNLGKTVQLILHSTDFKFFKYGEKPSESGGFTTTSPVFDLKHAESIELDLSKSKGKPKYYIEIPPLDGDHLKPFFFFLYPYYGAFKLCPYCFIHIYCQSFNRTCRRE